MRHGAELFAAGFTLSQVVHDDGDICQAITALAEACRFSRSKTNVACR